MAKQPIWNNFMRVLSATTRTLKISTLLEGDKCSTLVNDGGEKQIETLVDASDAYLVLVCVELGDDAQVVKRIANRIVRQWDSFRQDHESIVLVPFGHLSDMPNPNLAEVDRVTSKLFHTLKNKGLQVYGVKPNNAHCLYSELLIFDSGTSVRFSSSSNGLRTLLNDVLTVYGIKQVMSVLADLFAIRGKNK